MQASYDEAHITKCNAFDFSLLEDTKESESTTKETDEYGQANFKFPLPEFPLTQVEIDQFNKKCEEET